MLSIKGKLRNSKATAAWVLVLALLGSLWIKVGNLDIGAPYVTIDDATMYEAGFLVWFGNAPPQRTYVESWVSGISSITTYAVSALYHGESLGINIVADAYKDFYHDPSQYVFNYRLVMLLADLLTVYLVFILALKLLPSKPRSELYAVIAAVLYMLSYNTVWSNVVARPDTLTALFSTLGLVLYYSSGFGKHKGNFYLSAIAFGIATGIKLHAALFVVFIFVDYLRVKGLTREFTPMIPFGAISVFSFMVAAGSPLFDPLTYVKLRLLNIRDDASPWIEWGDQFLVVLEGVGWLVIPVILIFAFINRSLFKERSNPISSLLFIALAWILIFCLIRQLRAYWMLPALPLFYVLLAVSMQSLVQSQSKLSWVAMPLSGVLLVIFAFQSIGQYRELQQVRYSDLSDWIKSDVNPEQAFFVFGYESVNLPISSKNLLSRKEIIERKQKLSIANNETFTERHIRFWEERSRLTLYSMLEFKTDHGYDYYGFYSTPIADLNGVFDIKGMSFVLVQEGFEHEFHKVFPEYSQEFELVGTKVGPGGGGRGLSHKVYQRL
ncbi:MAG: hypothetical protein MK096_09620 [Oleiphilaceae bacterium]|nr:hypothetical protein [Oleiphilaceae bacterium]